MADNSLGARRKKAGGRAPSSSKQVVSTKRARGVSVAKSTGKNLRKLATVAKSRAPRARPAGRRVKPSPVMLASSPGGTEEERIESAKYELRPPERLFEEERFIFPDTYGINRVRLLVKDPDWLFVHWDVNPQSLSDLRRDVGERAVALSKLTLRVADPGNGGMSVVLLPPGVRSWYVRADATRRAYRAELGLTLPSGEFRRLAESNTVVTPRVGPSPERARRVVPYRRGRSLPEDAGLTAAAEDVLSVGSSSRPWSPGPESAGSTAATPFRGGEAPGGASDVHRR